MSVEVESPKNIFYGVRKANGLIAPAVFTAWVDVQRLTPVEYSCFSSVSEAIDYALANIEPMSGQAVVEAAVALTQASKRARTEGYDPSLGSDQKKSRRGRKKSDVKEVATANLDESYLRLMGVKPKGPEDESAMLPDPNEKNRAKRARSKDAKKATPNIPIEERRKEYLKGFDVELVRLRQFKVEYGDCDVPYRRGEFESSNGKTIDQAKYPGLGRWVAIARKQMKLYEVDPKTSLFTREEVRKLRDAGFIMNPTRGRTLENPKPIWDEEQFQELQRFVQKNGHAIVPKIKQFSTLRDWLDRVLQEGRAATLTETQIEKLTAMGVDWTWKRRFKLDESIERWIAWKTQNPAKEVPTDERLAAWVNICRGYYRDFRAGKKTSLKQEHVDKLSAMGFAWESKFKGGVKTADHIKSFDERLEELLAYKREYGDCRVPQIYPGLGRWVTSMRKAFKNWHVPGKKSSMTEERYSKLVEIGFIFERQPGGPRFNRQKKAGIVHPLQTQQILKNAPEGYLASYKYGRNPHEEAGNPLLQHQHPLQQQQHPQQHPQHHPPPHQPPPHQPPPHQSDDDDDIVSGLFHA